MHNRLARNLLLLLTSELPAYYVSTSSGNDTTGDGTALLPWATISKALATVPIAGNVNVFVDAGTYAENTAGAGFLNITRSFTDWVNVHPWHAGDAVVVTDSAGVDYCLRYNGGSHVRWYGVTVRQSASNTAWTVDLTGNVAAWFVNSTIETRNIGIFSRQTTYTVSLVCDDCILKKRSDVAGTIRCIDMRADNNATVTVTLNSCTVTNQSTSEEIGAVIGGLYTASTGTYRLTVNGGTFVNTGGIGIFVNGGTAIINNPTITTTSKQTLVIGRDTSPAFATTATINGGTYTCGTGHGMEIGYSADGVTVTGVTVNGGDYGLVLKECTNVTVTNSTLHGGVGVGAGTYFKAATNTSVTGCTITADFNSAILVGINPETANANHNNTLSNNTITVTGSGDIFNWGDDTADSGGSVCDSNTYDISGTSGDIGIVRGTDNIANLAALQAAWSTYDVTTNDANSTVIS